MASLAGKAAQNFLHKPVIVFLGLWLLTFLLYLPVADAGWVTDTVDWQQRVQQLPLVDYLNITQTRVPSLYQFTQLLTWLLYKALGFNHFAWHTLFVSLHAFNALLFFNVVAKAGEAAGWVRARQVALCTVILFCITPSLSEVIVWKASFHYLTALLFIFSVLWLVTGYLERPRIVYPVVSIALFLLSSFSLELFYTTPWLVLLLIMYYRGCDGRYTQPARRAILVFVLPMLVIFVVHLALLRHLTGTYAAHLGDTAFQPVYNYLRKAPLYCFHVLFFGRFYPAAAHQR